MLQGENSLERPEKSYRDRVWWREEDMDGWSWIFWGSK